MKKKVFKVCIFLGFFFLSMVPVIWAQTEEGLYTFMAVKEVRIEVIQSYGDAVGVSLPFKRVAAGFLKHAGVKVVEGNHNAILRIKATGKALGGAYQSVDKLEGGFVYTGAEVSGTILFERTEGIILKKSFEGRVKPSPSTFDRSNAPKDAPFSKAFENGFLSPMVEMIAKLYGLDVFIASALKDNDDLIRESAAYALGEIKDPRAVDPLITALKDEKSAVRVEARRALDKIGKPAVESLITALEDKDHFTRVTAVEVLGWIKDPRAVEPLIAALKDKDEIIRDRAVRALGEIKDPRAVEPLIATLKNKDHPLTREGAAYALGEIKDPRAVEPLITALKDKISYIRSRVAYALGEIKDPRAVEPLITALKDEDFDVRSRAAYALKNITGENFSGEPEKWQKWWEENKTKYKIGTCPH